MCQPGEHLLLCTCTKEDITTNDSDIRWSLHRFVTKIISVDKKKERHLILPGVGIRSHNEIGEQLTVEKVLDSLNNHQAFDFDYQPKKGDVLILSDQSGECGKDMLLVFKETSWGLGVNNSMLSYFVDMARGKASCLTEPVSRDELKPAWTEKELKEKAEALFQKPETRISWGGLMRLLGIKKSAK